jgi:hypothetical protein
MEGFFASGRGNLHFLDLDSLTAEIKADFVDLGP